jgi:hypothetical protein
MAWQKLLTLIAAIFSMVACQVYSDQENRSESGNIEKDVLILTDKTVNLTINDENGLLLVGTVYSSDRHAPPISCLWKGQLTISINASQEIYTPWCGYCQVPNHRTLFYCKLPLASRVPGRLQSESQSC